MFKKNNTTARPSALPKLGVSGTGFCDAREAPGAIPADGDGGSPAGWLPPRRGHPSALHNLQAGLAEPLGTRLHRVELLERAGRGPVAGPAWPWGGVGSVPLCPRGLHGSGAPPSAAVSPPNISLPAFPLLGRRMDVEALGEGSWGRAWAAVGRAPSPPRAALGPWQGPLAAALLPAGIYNLSLNGNSPGRSPNPPVPLGTG